MSITDETAKTKRRTISPYDLTSGDNPGAVISSPLLNGTNYDEWAINLRMALSSRKKFGFIDGSIPKPEANSPTLEDWVANNHLLVGWIKQTIETKIRSSISTREVAKELWDIIKKRFSVKSGARLQQLRNSLATCKQNGSSVDDYFGRLTKIWDGIRECMNTKQCSCGKCECDLNTAHEAERELLRVHDFLSGLDDTAHGVIRSQICAITPLPDLDSVYQTIVQNETIRSTVAQETQVMSFTSQVNRDQTRRPNNTVQASSSYPGNKDLSRKCTVCGRTGHEAVACFRVVGYPEWYGTSGRGRGGTNRGRSLQPRANSTQIVGANAAAVSSPVVLTEADRHGLTGISDEQWKIIQKMVGQKPKTDTLSGKNDCVEWILDTGATHHMTGKVECLEDVRPIIPVSVRLPTGSNVLSSRQGTVSLNSHLILHNVFLVDGFDTNLISFGQLVTDNGLVGQITDKLLLLQDRITMTLIGMGEREREGLYRMRVAETVTSLTTSVGEESVLWHHRLGHPSHRVVSLLPGVTSNKDSFKNCDICFRAKQTRQCFPDSSNCSNAIFDLIHCDLWGPYRTTALCGTRYFLTIVDDHSRAVWVYLLKDKTSVSSHLRDFITLIQTQFSKKIKTVRSDNGTEFLCLSRFFQENGIQHETSCVYTPQQNGRVERKHRHILNIARALRFQAHLPIEYWGECVKTAVYILNRTPSQLLNGKTPFERLYGRIPSFKHLRVFGCLAYAHNQHHHGDKFATRSRRCAFLGYPMGKKGWLLFDMDTEKVFVSRDVVFCEDQFPFAAMSQTLPVSETTPEIVEAAFDDSDSEAAEVEVEHDEELGTAPMAVTVMEQPPVVAPVPETNPIVTSLVEDVGASQQEVLGRGHRQKIPSSRLHDYIVNTVSLDTSLSHSEKSPSQQPSSGSLYPISDVLSCEKFSPRYRSFLASLESLQIPRSFQEAVRDKIWNGSMGAEMTALEEQHTWDLEHLPPNKKALDSKWVHTIKYNSDGTVSRPKSRLVVCGNRQKHGVDYTDTFSPVAKMTTVRVFLDYAAKKNHEVHQMDVHNAFLHGDLHEEVYMKIPQGFRSPNETRVCRLRKSLYGLKQAPRCWFAKLKDALINYGFTQTRSDYTLFVYFKRGVSIRLLAYVDDLIISGSSPADIKLLKDYLSVCFHMKDLGFLKYFLGIEVARSAAGFYLCQRKYATDIVTEMGLLGCKPAGSPMDQNHQLGRVKGPVIAEPERYRRLVGRLIYLAATRPDLTYSVHILSQFMQAPMEEHWLAALKVVRYLKGTLGQGILLDAKSPLHVTGWCDSDWGRCTTPRRSLSGWIVQLGASPISWKSKKQDTVSCSSAEAEYRAMGAITKELLWLKRLHKEMGVNHPEPMTLHCDSQSAIHISSNPVFHERTKNIEIECHFIRDEIVKGVLKPSYVTTKDQLADIFTKALGRKEFDMFFSKLGIRNLHAPT